jgi:hypothetical protein
VAFLASVAALAPRWDPPPVIPPAGSRQAARPGTGERGGVLGERGGVSPTVGSAPRHPTGRLTPGRSPRNRRAWRRQPHGGIRPTVIPPAGSRQTARREVGDLGDLRSARVARSETGHSRRPSVGPSGSVRDRPQQETFGRPEWLGQRPATAGDLRSARVARSETGHSRRPSVGPSGSVRDRPQQGHQPEAPAGKRLGSSAGPAHRPPPTAHRPPPTAHCPLPTAHRPPPTAHCPPPTAHRPLPTAHCPPPTAHCPLPTAHCPLPTAYCLLPTAHCLLPTDN